MPRLIDPFVARAVARRVGGDPEQELSGEVGTLTEQLAVAVPRAEELVAGASGIASPPPARWGVIDRATWAEANIAGMSKLVEPLSEKVQAPLDALPMPLRLGQRALLSVEVGALLGYVSRRVLGQYDLLVTENHDGRAQIRAARRMEPGTSIYFVGVNMVETQRKLSFVPSDFALWVALHEVTHRFQFAGVPWLRDRFFGLVEAYLGSVDLDARSLARRVGSAVSRLLTGAVPPEERNPAYLLADEGQRRTLDEIQALMAVVEGHGNYVMDSVGERVVPSLKRMRAAFDRRRSQTSAVQRAIHHAIGLEMKLRQYELGQRFCEQVVTTAGPDALGWLWREPDMFPTLAELQEPRTWLDRVA